MFPTSSLHSFALAAISLVGVVTAIPAPGPPGIMGLAFRTQINATGLGRLPDIDRAHAAALVSNAKNDNGILGKRDGSISVTNTAVTYTASVGIGSPATYYSEYMSPLPMLKVKYS
jgi:saccharopepsin